MNTVLLGNGINIQFGGNAYNSDFILKRIKYKARLNEYNTLFNNELTGKEIISIFNDFTKIANDIINNKYDTCINDKDTQIALDDFKIRYKEYLEKQFKKQIEKPHEIMLEDWFLLLHMFFLQNKDLYESLVFAKQGFEHLILDGIYNNGKIQTLYQKMPKTLKKYFNHYDNIFTLNYDNNIEYLTNSKVYHLHGSFSELANSENPNNVQGFIRMAKNERVLISHYEHCFCNALLNYSGELKYKTAVDLHNSINECDKLLAQNNSKQYIATLKDKNLFSYEFLSTKMKYPNLHVATEYHFNDFENITDKLDIIGLSPYNDNHIFNLILKNKNIKKINFYYYKDNEKFYMENAYPPNFCTCISVKELWTSLDCDNKIYNCNYNLPNTAEDIIQCINAISDDIATRDEIYKEIQGIPQFKMDKYFLLVKNELEKGLANSEPNKEKKFNYEISRISLIALQEGILPSTLYLIYIMNRTK